MISAMLSLALAASAANGAEAPAKAAKPKKVCEKIEVTGSTVPKRVCRTVVETAKPKDETAPAPAEAPAGCSTT